MERVREFQRLMDIIERYGEEVVILQRAMVSLPAVGPESGGEGETKKAAYVKTYLQRIGFDSIMEIDAPDARVPSGIRPNILARMHGTNRKRTIWIMSHLDVVPPGDLRMWSGDPFQLRVDGDRLIGRGVEDNHQGLVSSLLAAKAVKEAGLMPHCNIGLAIVADEETGNDKGLNYVMEKHAAEFGRDDLIIVPDAGDSLGQTIEIAEKGILWLKIEVRGKQCHASTPALGINAHRAAAHLVVKMDELGAIFHARNELFDPPESTFEPTKREANVPNINTIPPEDILYLDARVLPQYPLASVEEKIRGLAAGIEKRFGVTITLEPAQYAEAAPPTPESAAVVVALKRAIQEVKGLEAKCIGIGGGTVAAVFRRAGFPAAVWATLDDAAHQPDEYASIKNTLVDAQVMAHIFYHTV